MRNTKYLSFVLVTLFILSVSGQVRTISGQETLIEANFDVWYYTQSGSRMTESYALYVREALAPLGIDVKIVAKPWGQFVGDLLHQTTGQPFDLTHIRHEGGGPTPGFMWQYHSTRTRYGQSMYQLDSKEFQEWQEKEVGLSIAEIDKLLEDIEFEMNLVTRKTLITEFNELFMTKLLYDVPLVTKQSLITMWRGYGGVNNELWDPEEGIMDSRKLGATWTAATPADRVSNNTHMRLSTLTPARHELFDPYQSFDSITADYTRYMHNSLIDFDSNFTAHPGIAWNYYANYTPEDTYDHDYNASTPEVETYQLTWFLGNSTFWSETTDKDGNTVPAELVDALDFVLAYDMLKHPQTVVKGKELMYPILDYYANTTVFTNDTFTVKINAEEITPNDYYNFGIIAPVPDHLLGGVLNFNSTHFASVSDFANWNPQETEEWLHWASKEGHSLSGPYELVKYVKDEYYSYRQREDYWFPNEDDIAKYYDSDAFSALEQELGHSLNVFAPHENTENPEAFYWAFDDDIVSQGIETFEYLVIDDVNAEVLAFESGNIDSFESTELGAKTVENHQNNDNLVVKEQNYQSGPELIVFNLLHDDLKKINVRLAIAYAIGKDEFVKMHDGFANPHHSIVWSKYTDWIVPFEINHDYNKSRDLMRSEGYYAMEVPPIHENPEPPIYTRFVDGGYSFFDIARMIFIAVILPITFIAFIIFIRRKIRRSN